MPRSRPGRISNLSTRRARSSSFAMTVPKSSVVVSSASLQKIGNIKAPLVPPEGWQMDAFGYYDTIGEMAQQLAESAEAVAMCDFRPIVIDDENEAGDAQEDVGEKVKRVWKALLPGSGGRQELIRRAAFNLQICGEALFVGTPTVDEYGLENGIVWDFFSPREARVESGSGGRQIVKRDFGYAGSPPLELSPDTYVARLWRSDPQYKERPDCAVKHALPICSEIILLSQVVDAIAKSRLSAGIIYVPDEMSFGPDDETEDDSDETDQMDPVTLELIEQLTAPVEDRSSAASLVPLVMRGPADMADKIRLIEVARNLDTLFQEMRQEALGRLATSLDIPPESMLGKGGLSHWTGYNVDSDLIDKHIKPLGFKIAQFLTESYLRPMLIEFEDMTADEAARYRILFDPSPITSRSDMGPMSRFAYESGEISVLTFLRENGFDESDMPTEEERKIRDLRRLMFAEPLVFGPQIIGILYPDLEGAIEIPGYAPGMEPGDAPQNRSGVPERKVDTDPSGRPIIDKESGQGEPEPRGPAGMHIEPTIIERIASTADDALRTTIEQIAAEITSAMERKPGISAQYADVSGSKLINAVSGRHLKDLGIKVDASIEAALAPWRVATAEQLRDVFIANGLEETEARSRSMISANILFQFLAHAASAAGDEFGPIRLSGEMVESTIRTVGEKL